MSFATHLLQKTTLLQGKDRYGTNEYVVFRDKFDNTKGLIIPWSQVRVLLGPPHFILFLLALPSSTVLVTVLKPYFNIRKTFLA